MPNPSRLALLLVLAQASCNRAAPASDQGSIDRPRDLRPQDALAQPDRASPDSPPPDRSQPDRRGDTVTPLDLKVVDLASDGQNALWPCSSPGQPCNAKDPCVITATCGNDGLCHPTKMQSCDDGLTCTADSCAGAGICVNKVLPGYCALPVKGVMQCFASGAAHPGDPCLICDPANAQVSWSPSTGSACDDGDPCTKGDYCMAGTCKWTYYGTQCVDAYTCTNDVCDGKGGCLNPIKSSACLIGGLCYADGQKDSSGCKVCDVKKSQTAWTILCTP